MSAQGMPPQLLALFAPRQPLNHIKPAPELSFRGFSGTEEFLEFFETQEPPTVPSFETPKERRERMKAERKAAHDAKLEEARAAYDPQREPEDGNVTRDPYATLFIASLSYEVTEKKLKREFEKFGPIRKVVLIKDKDSKPRGYAFIEYETEEDMKEAYKACENKKIDGRRVIVDVERSRTVTDWLPRRLGGGKGPGRFAVSKKQKQKERAALLAQTAANTPLAPSNMRNTFSGGMSSGRFGQQSTPRGGDRQDRREPRMRDDRGSSRRPRFSESWNSNRFESRGNDRHPRDRDDKYRRPRSRSRERDWPQKERRRSSERGYVRPPFLPDGPEDPKQVKTDSPPRYFDKPIRGRRDSRERSRERGDRKRSSRSRKSS